MLAGDDHEEVSKRRARIKPPPILRESRRNGQRYEGRGIRRRRSRRQRWKDDGRRREPGKDTVSVAQSSPVLIC